MILIRFVYNNKLLLTDERNLSINQIESRKASLSFIYECDVEDIDIIFQEVDLSDIDVSPKGMYHWQKSPIKHFNGVGLSIELGSDEHLDSILDNTMENYLKFI